VRGNLAGRFLSAAAERVERATWLDPAARSLQDKLQPLRRSRVLTNLLSGTPAGHPVHPLLVTVPIGSWTGALVFDVLKNRPAARTLVGLGVLAAAPTIATGLSDWKDTSAADRRVGFVHGLLNAALVTLYGASWAARRVGQHRWGVRVTWPALVALGLSGWLGGHLSYARGVGVDVNAWAPSRSEWTDVGDAAAVVTGRLMRAEVGGVPVLLARLAEGAEGRVVAYAERCAHRGGPLSEGVLLADDCVQCPWHGSRYSLVNGSVVSGPSTRPQPAFEVRVEAGRVLVRREASHAAPEMNATLTRREHHHTRA
jgi:nitrite reductase/ring-hydroxylating ferredoxin subunit/uncharacterized membrane protein